MAAGNQRNRVFMDRNKFTPPIEQKIYEIDAPEPDAQKSILLLEDETEFAHMVKEYLESCEFQVTVVRDGVQGLKKVMERDFDVIVCDLLMPNLPGDMFYVGVERVRPHLANRFIFITCHPQDRGVCSKDPRADPLQTLPAAHAAGNGAGKSEEIGVREGRLKNLKICEPRANLLEAQLFFPLIPSESGAGRFSG